MRIRCPRLTSTIYQALTLQDSKSAAPLLKKKVRKKSSKRSKSGPRQTSPTRTHTRQNRVCRLFRLSDAIKALPSLRTRGGPLLVSIKTINLSCSWLGVVMAIFSLILTVINLLRWGDQLWDAQQKARHWCPQYWKVWPSCLQTYHPQTVIPARQSRWIVRFGSNRI